MHSLDELEIKFQRMVPLGGPHFSEVMAAMKESFDVEPSNFKVPPQFLEAARQMANQLPAMRLMQISLLHLLTETALPEKKTVDYLHAVLVENDLELDLQEPPHILANRIADMLTSCLAFVLTQLPEDSKQEVLRHMQQAIMDKLSKRRF